MEKETEEKLKEKAFIAKLIKKWKENYK